MAVSFDLFGTLVAVERPADPATVVGQALAERGVSVPSDWSDAYYESHGSRPPGRETPLAEHVREALASRGVTIKVQTASEAVLSAFTSGHTVETRSGASDALACAGTRGPVGVCSNCAVTGLVEWALAESSLDADSLDAVVTSVDCGWRKPDARAFEAVADAFGVDTSALIHVGDDPETDGGVSDVGGEFVDVETVPLQSLCDELEGRSWD